MILIVDMICLWKQSSGPVLLPAVNFILIGEKQNKENNFFPLRISMYSRQALSILYEKHS